MFVCCGGGAANSGAGMSDAQRERLMSEESVNLSIVMSENGRRSYIFEAPLVRGYLMAKEPYREFDKGVNITTFSDDSLSVRDVDLRSNYALYYENRRLWEARGDVEVRKSDGKELYSQQLYWNAQTKMIYSNVETTIYDRETGDVYVGEGFESDEEMVNWSFRKLTGRMKMNMPKGEASVTEEETSEEKTSEREREATTPEDEENEN